MGTSRPEARNRQISRNQARKQKLDKSISFRFFVIGHAALSLQLPWSHGSTTL